MPARFLVNYAEAGHGRCGLNQDDAIEHEIPEAQAALQSSFLRRRSHRPPLLVVEVFSGVSLTGAIFHPSTCTESVSGASSGNCAVSSDVSPGASSIQLSDQYTGAIRPPFSVVTAART